MKILSPSSIRRDRYEKLEQYARFRVPEYSIVDLANRSAEILALENDRYTMHSIAVETGKVTSRVLAGFELDLAKIF